MKRHSPFNLNSVVPYRQDPNRKKWIVEIGTILLVVSLLFLSIGVIIIMSLLFLNHTVFIDIKKIYFDHLLWAYNYFGTPLFYTIVCIIGPILEELAFRFGLKFEKRKIILSIPLILLFISTPNIYIMRFTIYNVLKIILLIALYFIMWKRTDEELWFKIKRQYGNLIIYFFILLFALAHIREFAPLLLIYAPYYVLFLLPLFVLAFGITFIRLRFGILYSMAAHMLYNLMMIHFVLISLK